MRRPRRTRSDPRYGRTRPATAVVSSLTAGALFVAVPLATAMAPGLMLAAVAVAAVAWLSYGTYRATTDRAGLPAAATNRRQDDAHPADVD